MRTVNRVKWPAGGGWRGREAACSFLTNERQCQKALEKESLLGRGEVNLGQGEKVLFNDDAQKSFALIKNSEVSSKRCLGTK